MAASRTRTSATVASLATLCAVAFAPSLHAQETRTVQGVVRDSVNGEAVVHAAVLLKGTQRVVETNPDGFLHHRRRTRRRLRADDRPHRLHAPGRRGRGGLRGQAERRAGAPPARARRDRAGRRGVAAGSRDRGRQPRRGVPGGAGGAPLHRRGRPLPVAPAPAGDQRHPRIVLRPLRAGRHAGPEPRAARRNDRLPRRPLLRLLQRLQRGCDQGHPGLQGRVPRAVRRARLQRGGHHREDGRPRADALRGGPQPAQRPAVPSRRRSGPGRTCW